MDLCISPCFLFAHICRNSLFIICSLQNSSYCLLSTISGIFTINALLQQPCVPFHFDKQASFATSTPTNFCLQNHQGLFMLQIPYHMIETLKTNYWGEIKCDLMTFSCDPTLHRDHLNSILMYLGLVCQWRISSAVSLTSSDYSHSFPKIVGQSFRKK